MAYDTELAQWRAARLAALTAEDGWLNLTDRLELQPGRQSVGSGEGCDLCLSVGPQFVGIIEVSPSGEVALHHDGGTGAFVARNGGNPMLRIAGLLLEIHTVEGQPALRVRQIDHPSRTGFAGLRYFPTDPALVVIARWEKLATPKAMPVDMVSGAVETVTQTHVARFSLQDQEFAMVPTHTKAAQPMFVIRDATSGRQTYGASRFLLGDVLDDQTIRLDFNRLHNPPCAFTDFAICPLPPRENILSIALQAGELAP